MSEAALLRRSTAAIEQGSKSFAAAARLFDPRTRESAVILYAWCRHCDDVVDGQMLGRGQRPDAAEEAGARLDELRRRTEAVFRGEQLSDPAFAALAETVRRHAIPQRWAFEHLDGFAMDVAGQRYRTIEETLLYCYRVAGVVGLMMARVMGVTRADTLDRACDLGIAFQLTNIARDILDDAASGRVYLPEQWLEEAQIPLREIAGPRHRERLAGVAARLIRAAEPYYDSAATGIRDLPFRSAWAVATARSVYRHIGVEVVRRGASAWDERVSTSRPRKLAAVLGGAGSALAAAALGRVSSAPLRAGLWTRPT